MCSHFSNIDGHTNNNKKSKKPKTPKGGRSCIRKIKNYVFSIERRCFGGEYENNINLITYHQSIIQFANQPASKQTQRVAINKHYHTCMNLPYLNEHVNGEKMPLTHNMYLAAIIIIAIVLAGWLVGCHIICSFIHSFIASIHHHSFTYFANYSL